MNSIHKLIALLYSVSGIVLSCELLVNILTSIRLPNDALFASFPKPKWGQYAPLSGTWSLFSLNALVIMAQWLQRSYKLFNYYQHRTHVTTSTWISDFQGHLTCGHQRAPHIYGKRWPAENRASCEWYTSWGKCMKSLMSLIVFVECWVR